MRVVVDFESEIFREGYGLPGRIGAMNERKPSRFRMLLIAIWRVGPTSLIMGILGAEPNESNTAWPGVAILLGAAAVGAIAGVAIVCLKG
jgi:hypothetical protein